MKRIEYPEKDRGRLCYLLEITMENSHFVYWRLIHLDYNGNPDGTPNEEPLFTGSTKWDGCSDLQFIPDGENGSTFLVHFCDLSEWQIFSRVLEWVYRTAYGMIENRDGDLE